MRKIKTSQDKVLKKSKRIKVGKKGNMRIAAAEWVDDELIDHIETRGKLSRKWRIARKKQEPQEVLNKCKEEYKSQQIKTSNMAGKKRRMGKEKNHRNKKRWKKVLEPNKRLIRKE